MMLATQGYLPNTEDPTPVRGWVRGRTEFHLARKFVDDPATEFWAPDAIAGYSCEYVGALTDGTFLHYRDTAYVVPDDGYFRVEIMMIAEIRDADGGLLEPLNAAGVDASYFRRASLYDALREAEEAIAEDCRTGVVPMLSGSPDRQLAGYQAEGFRHDLAERPPLDDPFTARPFPERIAEMLRARTSK